VFGVDTCLAHTTLNRSSKYDYAVTISIAYVDSVSARARMQAADVGPLLKRKHDKPEMN
jgi:hypothetical protein